MLLGPLLLPLQMAAHGVVSIESLRSGRLWTALTAAFSHRDLMHLGANMVGLYFFGRGVGRMFGGKQVRGRAARRPLDALRRALVCC